MNHRHQTFIEHYVANGYNGTKAYMAVYPDSSYEAAMSSASALLRDPQVAAAVEHRKQNLLNELGITAQWIVEKMREAAERAVLSQSPASASRPLELLGRQHGLFIEKTEQAVTQTTFTINMGHDIGPDEEEDFA